MRLVVSSNETDPDTAITPTHAYTLVVARTELNLSGLLRCFNTPLESQSTVVQLESFARQPQQPISES